MRKKRLAAMLLAASLVMSAAIPTVSAAEPGTDIAKDTAIHDAQLVNIVEDGVRLNVHGEVDTIVVPAGSDKAHIVIHRDGSVRELIVEGSKADIELYRNASVDRLVLSGSSAKVSNRGYLAAAEISGSHNEIAVHRDGSVGDILVTGDDTAVSVVRGADICRVALAGDQASVTGNGILYTVDAQGSNAEIRVPDARVTVGSDARNIVAGGVVLNPGDDVLINHNGRGVTPLEPATVPQVMLGQQAKLVDLGWTRYVAVSFAKGFDLSNTAVWVDGVDVTAFMTPVTNDGSIVKYETTALGHAEVVLVSGEHTQALSLGEEAGIAAAAVSGAPDYFLLNGPVYVWDYHLTNYDDAGNIRVSPAKTTLSLGVDADHIPSYSPDAILHHDDSALPYFVTGEVQLMFNYNTEAEKAFVDGITDVDLVSFSEYHNTLNDSLTYTLDKAFPHGDHTVACIQVPIGQVNFTSNGRYNLRVTSGGKARLFPIHVVEEVVPTMTITGDTGYYGNEVHFRIENMTYGITRPIYRVDLQNPAGETFTLNLFDDWFLHGDLLVLYNTNTNYFPLAGTYTVTCYADGFQTFSKTFHHDGFASAAPEGAPVDAISSASVGGGGSSGGGDAGDTKVMNANLILDADLLANAKIVVSLGLQDAAAEGIAHRWDSMTKLYVFNEGAETVYTADAYFDAVNTAMTQGQGLTFAAYIASGAAVTTGNRPYAVKQVLEDNLLGETTSFREAVGAAAPELVLTAQNEKTATFTCTDKAFLSAVAQGDLRLNGGLLTADQYTVDADAGTLTLSTVKVGKNTLKLTVPGYKAVEVIFEISKVLEEVSLSVSDITLGQEITVTCGSAAHACDFFANLTSVTLTAPTGKTDTVMPEGAESLFEKIGYTVADNTLTIGKDTLNQAFAHNEDGSFAEGVYTLTLTADYYGTKTLTLTVTAPVETSKDAPAVEEIVYKTQFMGGNYYHVSFVGTEDDTAAFVAAINNITVNGQKVTPVASFFNNTLSYKTSNDPAYGGKYRFLDFTEDCFKGEAAVVISADGYSDLTFTVVDGQLQESKPVLLPAPSVAALEQVSSMTGAYDRLSFKDDVTAYLPAVTSVTVNGKSVKAVTGLFGESFAYTLSNDPAYGGADKFIDFTADCLRSGEVTLVIEANGYETLTVKLVDGKLLKAVPGFQHFTFVKDMFRGDHYRLSFNTVDAVSSATGGGSVNPGIPELPEPSPELVELYNYVSALKTYMNEAKDSSITLNGVECVESGSLTLEDSNSFLVFADSVEASNNAVCFSTDCFDNKTVEIVISVYGYEDLVLTVTGETVPTEPDPTDPQIPEGDLPAPVVTNVEHKLSAFSGNSFIIKMAAPEGLNVQDHTYTFLRNLSEVKVNGTVFTEAASFGSLGDTQYRVNASSGEFVLSENALGKGVGSFELVLTAPGYQTMTFRIVDGQLGAEVPALPAAPAPKNMTFTSSFTGSVYTLSFEGDAAAAEQYLKAVTAVTVDGAPLRKVSSFFGDTMSYKFSNDPAFGGPYCFLDFTADCFTGTHQVVISAEGYEPLTFTVTDGKLA